MPLAQLQQHNHSAFSRDSLCSLWGPCGLWPPTIEVILTGVRCCSSCLSAVHVTDWPLDVKWWWWKFSFAHWAVSWVDLLVLLVISGREVWQWMGTGSIFIPLSMSQSAETCPCLWSLLCLVYFEAWLAANLQGEVANVVASVSSSYPAGRKMLVVGPMGLSCCMNYQYELRAGEVVKCASQKSNSTPSKMKLKWSVARIITWSWENGDTLKEALQPKHCSAGWFPDR